MENERVLIATDRNTLKLVLSEVFKPESEPEIIQDFEKDKISKPETAKLIGRTIPTVNKLIHKGILKDYGFGKRGKYLLKSEVLKALRNSNI